MLRANDLARKGAFMDTWRLIPLQTQNAFMNMAIDEAILTARVVDNVPNTLRLYQWQSEAVSIGRNQTIEQVHMTNVSEKGIDIVRRISGGGVMYHDQHIEVSYSVVARASNLGENPTRVRLRTCEAVVDALRLLGIPADTDLRNANNHPNLTVSNKIISCSTQIVKSGILLQQGYVLLRNNLPEMFNAVCIVQTNYRLKTAVNPENKATSIESELHHYVSAETVANALAQGFRAMLEINLQPSTLTNYETELAQELCEHKYVTDSWNQKGIEA